MAVTSFFPIGCMIWQHAVILESIWETDLNITHFPVQRTGRLTPLLTRLLYFSLLLGQIYSKSNSLSPFFFFGQKFSKSNSSPLFSLGENFLSPIPLLSPLGRNYSKTNFSSAKFFWDNSKFCLSRKTDSVLQHFSKTILNSVLVAKPIQICKNILSPNFLLT